MTVLGIYVSKLSGIWILSAVLVLYPLTCLFFWCLCKAYGDADHGEDWK